MKKVLLSLACVAFMATIAVNFYVQQHVNPNEILLTDIEALAQGGGGDPEGGGGGGGAVVKCKCASFLGRGCKASNKGSLCAQGEEGGNVDCRNHDSNC